MKLIDAGGDRDSLDVIAAERRGATLQDQLAKREASGRVAQIFDVGDREGYFYIAMEYIEGEDLSELVARGPLDPQRAVAIALDILDVLVKAHTFQTVIEDRTHRGIIHGDIKPRNIRITAGGPGEGARFRHREGRFDDPQHHVQPVRQHSVFIARAPADGRYGCAFGCVVGGDRAVRDADRASRISKRRRRRSWNG